jgi:spermidine synthase
VPSIDISEERGVRFLHFGSPWVQGAMRIARPWSLELEYTRDLMMPLLLRGGPEWPRTVLQVGLGAASITRFLYRYRPLAKLTIVEILPQVVAAARQFFKLPEDPGRITIMLGDAHEYVARRRGRFDLIVVDGFDERGRAGMLDSVPFYLNCRALLSADGMFSANFLTRTRGVSASVRRLREAFDDRVLVLPPSEAGNVVVLAAVGRPVVERLEGLRASARRLARETGLDLASALARLEQSGAAKAGELRL